MDVISFTNPNHVTKMEQGIVVNNLSSKTWIERYSTAGEFTFIGPVSAGIKEILPIGSFVSHVDSDDIMIVEDHEINENQGTSPDIKVTGRGFETYLDNRTVGANKAFPVTNTGGVVDYSLVTEHTWNQAVTMIADHILATDLIDDTYALPYTSVLSTVVPLGTETPEAARLIKRGGLYSAVLDLLKIDNHGIKVIRPGATSPLTGGEVGNLAIIIHNATDRTATISISQKGGEIVSADYLWSNRTLKNSALVTGKWVEIKVDPISSTEYGIRMMYVDGSDADKDLTAAPAVGPDLDAVVNAMHQIGREALLSQRELVLNKAETAKSGIAPMYRKDYFIGDLITVVGDFDETQAMRVSEYVEIEDNTGVSSYPTLTIDGEQS